MAMGTIIPSIFLSGYVLPVDSMPEFFKIVAFFIPTTWLIDAVRGIIILRGTDWSHFGSTRLVLWAMAIFVIAIAGAKDAERHPDRLGCRQRKSSSRQTKTGYST